MGVRYGSILVLLTFYEFVKSVPKFMCEFVYIFGRILWFNILGDGTFSLIQCVFLHLEILLFITIFIHKPYYFFIIIIIIT